MYSDPLTSELLKCSACAHFCEECEGSEDYCTKCRSPDKYTFYGQCFDCPSICPNGCYMANKNELKCLTTDSDDGLSLTRCECGYKCDSCTVGAPTEC